MAESREQFLERIGRIACDAEFGPGQWDTEGPVGQVIACDVAEAVYAEALRDVVALLESSDATVHQSVATSIRTFAAERGIDLEAPR